MTESGDISLLRWRIEQQSDLIMKLKEELDEKNYKVKVQEKIQEDTSKLNKHIGVQIQEERKRFKTLEKEFNIVSENFDALNKIKEKIKDENAMIEKEIRTADEKNTKQIAEVIDNRRVKVEDANKRISSIRILLGELEIQYSNLTVSDESDLLLEEYEMLKTIQARTIKELEKMTKEVEMNLTTTMAELASVKQERDRIETERSFLTNRYETENAELEAKILEERRQIRETQARNVELEKKQAFLKEELKKARSRFRLERSLIDPEMVIEKLSTDLEDINEENKKAIKEFVAYQKHAEMLLEREQQLNKKFELLSS